MRDSLWPPIVIPYRVCGWTRVILTLGRRRRGKGAISVSTISRSRAMYSWPWIVICKRARWVSCQRLPPTTATWPAVWGSLPLAQTIYALLLLRIHYLSLMVLHWVEDQCLHIAYRTVTTFTALPCGCFRFLPSSPHYMVD